MILSESIRVSTYRMPEYGGDVVTTEWCVTGDPVHDTWCTGGRVGKPEIHTHHRSISFRINDGMRTGDPRWLSWTVALTDPFDIYASVPAIRAGWSVEDNAYFGWLFPNGRQLPGTGLVLAVTAADTMLGCGRHKLENGDHTTDHMCLVKNRCAA